MYQPHDQGWAICINWQLILVGCWWFQECQIKKSFHGWFLQQELFGVMTLFHSARSCPCTDTPEFPFSYTSSFGTGLWRLQVEEARDLGPCLLPCCHHMYLKFSYHPFQTKLMYFHCPLHLLNQVILQVKFPSPGFRETRLGNYLLDSTILLCLVTGYDVDIILVAY